VSNAAAECNPQRCRNDYNPHDKVCDSSPEYRTCLEKLAKPCHGDLYYRLLMRGLQNCSSTAEAPPVAPTSLPQPPETTCQRLPAGEEYGQCALYGDPHLQTFGGKLQTCRALGAWPMVDNAYLAVQVTNSHAGATATVVSKVVVVVHSHGSCALEKTYEAQIRDLPSVFKDGTTSAGRGVELTTPELDLVELTLSHAGVRLRIRQHGDYLSVALRMPTGIAGEGRQICSQGCPARELLPELRDVEKWRREEAEASCRKANLTGAYWDACVFDVLSTGDTRSADAASAAVADLRNLGASAPSREAPSPSDASACRASLAVIALAGTLAWVGLRWALCFTYY
ncbi:unnamed protein product, partial [Ixodes hexagonus]